MSINLKTLHSGHYLVAEGGTRIMKANRYQASDWETFEVLNKTRAAPDVFDGDRISLRAWDGKYVSADSGGGGEVRTRGVPDAWETFTVLRVAGAGQIGDSETVRLQTSNGNFLVAEEGGEREVRANRAAPDLWETFIFEVARRRVAYRFRSVGLNRYLSADGDAGGTLRVLPVAADRFEAFTLFKRTNVDSPLQHNDLVNLRAWNGDLLLAEAPGAGGAVRSERHPRQPAVVLSGPKRNEREFQVQRIGGAGPIQPGDQVTLFSPINGQFLTARPGGLPVTTQAAGANQNFTVELA